MKNILDFLLLWIRGGKNSLFPAILRRKNPSINKLLPEPFSLSCEKNPRLSTRANFTRSLFLILLLLLPLSVAANPMSEAFDEALEARMENSGIHELSQTLEQASDGSYREIVPEFDMEAAARRAAKGEWSRNPADILRRLLGMFLRELTGERGSFLGIIALALAAAVIENLQRSFNAEGVGEVAFFTCFFMVAALGIKVFTNTVQYAAEAVDGLVLFIYSLVPVTLTLLASSGAPASAGVFHQVMLLSAQTVSMLIKSLVIPLITLYTALSAANNISGNASVGRLAGIFKNAAKWTLGIMTTLFLGIISLYSITAPAIDGVYVKTAKYAVGNFVPIVGSVLSETVDLVFGCSVVLKNAIGAAGLIAIACIAAVPLIKLLAGAAMFSLAAAIIEPVSDKRTVSLLGSLSEAVTLLFAAVITTALMFIISTAVVIAAGNTAASLI